MDKQISNEPEKSTLRVDNPMGRRIEYQGAFGSVKYSGPLLHDKEKSDPNQIWLGIEWDDVTRGRHNGTVEGCKYFETSQGLTNGSLLKADKANFGINIYDGILLRYFNKKSTESENKENKTVNEKGIQVEYDEDAYFETVRKFKKKVEFLGFDKIWKKINDLKNLEELSLPECLISDLGPDGALEKLLPKMKNLSLEGNLIYDWNQIYMIGKELKSLEWLSLSNNRLSEPEEITEQKKIFINSNDTYIDVPPLGNVFLNLKTIILINLGLTWKTLNKILPGLLNVESLVLCYNQCNDFENLKFSGKDFPNLLFLNVEGNGLESFEGLKTFKDAPKLERLIVSKNKIKELGDVSGFQSLKQFIIEENEISDFRLFSQLNKFGSVQNLRVTKNPVYNRFTALHIRQRAIAEIKSLNQANGSELKKLERKDCEIYYLRDSFREFFEVTGQNPDKYSLNEFLEYCSLNHPRVPELMAIYGNPYEDVKTVGSTTTTTRKMASFVNIKLYALCGPSLGKPPQTKKFTDNTLITNLKAMLAKQFGIPANKQRIWHKADPHDPFIQLEEDLKDLNYYGVREGHEIWVGDEDTEV